jgi:putative ABC transport system permease protein
MRQFSERLIKHHNLVTGPSLSVSESLIGKTSEDSALRLNCRNFQTKDLTDPFWYINMDTLNKSMIIDFDLLKNNFVKNGMNTIYKAEWYYALDYHKIRLSNNSKLNSTLNSHVTWFNKNNRLLKLDLPVLSIIKQYSERESQLKTTLLVLQVPVLLMLALYTFMISKLKIDYESNEIAVLKSRGASMKQVFYGYLVESCILGLIALLLGPPLGLILCKVLGASNGFLEFVDRASLPVDLNIKNIPVCALCRYFFHDNHAGSIFSCIPHQYCNI